MELSSSTIAFMVRHPTIWRENTGDAVLGERTMHRLEPEPVPVFVDELDHHGSRGSSSRAKN